jgi:xylulokinase
MGLDLSTQQLKAVVIDEGSRVVHQLSVVFDRDLKGYGTTDGVICHDDKLTVTVPTLMWVEAFDKLLADMKNEGIPLNCIAGISGCGQQHGSVYWKKGAAKVLHSLNPSKLLSELLNDQFSIAQSPIWMDSSTTAQCQQMEAAVGGAQKMADITGSRAYERFTGNQILKISQTKPAEYAATERISLVSSFCASLLSGSYADIDYSDGSGMNLMNIKTKEWDPKLTLEAGGTDLGNKLGMKPVPSKTAVGCISSYFVQRYGFSPSCTITSFMGDNPSSLAGMQLKQGDVVVSLGTSDTVFVWLEDPQPQLMGHIFANPVDDKAYLALLCYKNASLARLQVCEECAGGSWEMFDKILESTPPGNDGYMSFFFPIREITPDVKGIYHFKGKTQVEGVPPEIKARAIIEGQLLAKFNHARRLGYNIGPSSRILATGGASANKQILQVCSDVP